MKDNIIQTFCCCLLHKQHSNGRKFLKHLKDKHNIKSRVYYDKFLKKETEGACAICSKNAIYKTFFVGYSETCSSFSCIAKTGEKNYGKIPKNM
jgi:hypothetical protein